MSVSGGDELISMVTGSVGCTGVGDSVTGVLLPGLLFSWLLSVSSAVVLLSPAVALCGHKHRLNTNTF